MGNSRNPLIRPIVYPRGDRAAYRGEADHARNNNANEAARERGEKLTGDDEE